MKEKHSTHFWIRKFRKKNRSVFGFFSLLISVIALVISIFTFYQTEYSNKMNRIIDGINLLNSEETFPSGIYFLKLDQSLTIEEKTRLLLNAVLFNLTKRDINPFESFETANLLFEWGSNYYGNLFEINQQCFRSYETTKLSGSSEYFYCVKNSGEIIIDLIQLDNTSFINQSLLKDVQINIPMALYPVKIEGHNYSKIDFSGININNSEFVFFAQLLDSKWNEAKLTNVRLTNAQLQGASFKDASLFGINFTGAVGFNSSFENSTISSSRFIAADFKHANFSNVKFTSTVLFEDNYCVPGNHTYNDKMISNYEGANFNNAEGLSQGQKKCLCLSGAINVPGGCEIFDISN